MVERLIRRTAKFVVLIAVTLLLPLFCSAAWLWGSKDEQWLMKVLFCVLSPFCACLWYILLSHLVLRSRSSYFVQLLVFIGSAAGVVLLIMSGGITF